MNLPYGKCYEKTYGFRYDMIAYKTCEALITCHLWQS